MAAIRKDVAQRFQSQTKSAAGKAFAGQVSQAIAAALPSRLPMGAVQAALQSAHCPVRPQQQVLIPMGGIAAAIAGLPVTSLSQANALAAAGPLKLPSVVTPKSYATQKSVPVSILS